MKNIKKIEENVIYKLTTKIGLLIIVALLFVGIYQIYATIPQIKGSVTLATTVKPETFTELYFEEHNNLPNVIEPNRSYNFTFTIHNLESQRMNYLYIVYLQTVSKKTILNQGSVNLADGEYKSITEYFGPLTNFRIKITVELINKNQLIDFWMNPSL
jgi:hypothetical protein